MKQPVCIGAVCAAALVGLAACGGQPEEVVAPAAQPRERPAAVARAGAVPVSAAPGLPMASTRAPDDLALLKQQMASVQRELAELRLQVARGVPAAPGEDSAADSRRDPESRAEAEREERTRVASTEAAFRGEANDPRWSQGTSSGLRAAVSEFEALRNQVRSIECRSQSCRVELTAGAPGRLSRDMPRLVSRLSQTLPNVTSGQIDQGNGQSATVLYLSR